MTARHAFTADEELLRAAYARRRNGSLYSWSNPGHAFLTQQLEWAVLRLLRRSGIRTLDDVRILDVGCGYGQWLGNFVRWGARPENVVGVDLLEDRAAEARQRCPAGVTIRSQNAVSLDDPDASYDLVVQFTMFTSILNPRLQQAIAAEMLRVLKPDGAIVWYDYHVRSPRNPDVRAIGRREIRRLFPSCRVDLERVTLAPPLARALAGKARWMCEALSLVPLLRTHYLGLIRRTRS